jgi:hypothetical protein
MRGSTEQLSHTGTLRTRLSNDSSRVGQQAQAISGYLIFIVLFFIPITLRAQAWLFGPGEGTFAISYQNVYVREHAFSKGEATDRGHSLSHVLNADLDYSLTRKLAVRIGMPYVTARYSGSSPHPTVNDDGTYHGTLQDYSFDLRYNVMDGPLVVTPFFTAVIPSHGYEYFAHSAVGKDVHEYHVGTNVGRRLDPILPEAYIQARYSYAFVSRILGVKPNRSNVEVQFGYFIKPGLSVMGTLQGAYTHSGLDLRLGIPLVGLTEEQWRVHDQIARDNILDAGGGLVYSLNPSLEMFASVARSVAGRNTHLHASVVTVGFSRTFGSGLKEIGQSSLAGAPAPRKALVCTCARTK